MLTDRSFQKEYFSSISKLKLHHWIQIGQLDKIHELASERANLESEVLILILDGLADQAIESRLSQLIQEVEFQSELDIANHLERLPTLMLVPILLFQFPAFLILLLGPILKIVLKELNQ